VKGKAVEAKDRMVERMIKPEKTCGLWNIIICLGIVLYYQRDQHRTGSTYAPSSSAPKEINPQDSNINHTAQPITVRNDSRASSLPSPSVATKSTFKLHSIIFPYNQLRLYILRRRRQTWAHQQEGLKKSSSILLHMPSEVVRLLSDFNIGDVAEEPFWECPSWALVIVIVILNVVVVVKFFVAIIAVERLLTRKHLDAAQWASVVATLAVGKPCSGAGFTEYMVAGEAHRLL